MPLSVLTKQKLKNNNKNNQNVEITYTLQMYAPI